MATAPRPLRLATAATFFAAAACGGRIDATSAERAESPGAAASEEAPPPAPIRTPPEPPAPVDPPFSPDTIPELEARCAAAADADLASQVERDASELRDSLAGGWYHCGAASAFDAVLGLRLWEGGRGFVLFPYAEDPDGKAAHAASLLERDGSLFPNMCIECVRPAGAVDVDRISLGGVALRARFGMEHLALAVAREDGQGTELRFVRLTQ
jgi:hypothetical protein